MVDLHLHTNYSDGQYPPAQVVFLAAAAGVSLLAVTDHDTVAGLETSARAAAEHGIGFIPGIEISTDAHRDMHMLGYYIDAENTPLRDFCALMAQQRREREGRIYGFLAQRGIVLTPEQVNRYIEHELVGRPHFARAMVAAGYVATTQEAFDKHLATPAFAALERPKPTPEESIALIARAGGAAVLAHPGLLAYSDEALQNLICRLIPAGLKGLECHYSLHTPAQTAFYTALARKYHLLITGGSDFHGEAVKPDIRIGYGTGDTPLFADSGIADRLYAAAHA